jgi:enamine deaminase RidA (YjgF/YER057c/UK114 family)
MKCANATGVVTPGGPYHHGAQVFLPDSVLAVSGQFGVDEQGDVGTGIASQLQRSFHNIERVLASFDYRFEDVIRFNLYLTPDVSLDELTTAREALYPRLFPTGLYPASTSVVVHSLMKPEYLIEVEALAAKPRSAARN